MCRVRESEKIVGRLAAMLGEGDNLEILGRHGNLRDCGTVRTVLYQVEMGARC